MAERMLDRPDQGGDRRPGAIRGSVDLRGAECGGVHGTSQIMTILVMYTKACIRTGVKRRGGPPERAVGVGRG